MFEGIGRAVDGLIAFVWVSMVFAWPLALWKLIDIAIWLTAHLQIAWN